MPILEGAYYGCFIFYCIIGEKGNRGYIVIHIKNKSDALIIVLHEIYGINQYMKNICKSLAEKGFDVLCPNLLQEDRYFDYSEENIAYHQFMENVGFTRASEQVKHSLRDLKEQYKKVFMEGFSVGATVAWLCTEDECVDGMVGYYGSRIRDYDNIEPKCPALLFFPEKEQSFHVDELISRLKRKNIEIHQLEGQHGFSDPYSPHFNETSAQKAFTKMVDFFRKA